MKKRGWLTVLLAVVMLLSLLTVTAAAEEHEHSYDNGFCTEDGCDAYEPVTLNSENVYEISNAGQLYWFAGLVNGTLEGVTQNTSCQRCPDGEYHRQRERAEHGRHPRGRHFPRLDAHRHFL